MHREVDVLEAREQLGTVGRGVRRLEQRERPHRSGATGELAARVVGEDLLPRVVALERRQVRAADEPLRLVLERYAAIGAGEPLDERAHEPRQAADALGEQVRGVRVVAAEELIAALARECDLHIRRREPRDEVGRQRRGVGERLVERVRERR